MQLIQLNTELYTTIVSLIIEYVDLDFLTIRP